MPFPKRRDMPEELSLGELARLMGVEYEMLRSRARRGQLPCKSKRRGEHYRVGIDVIMTMFPDIYEILEKTYLCGPVIPRFLKSGH